MSMEDSNDFFVTFQLQSLPVDYYSMKLYIYDFQILCHGPHPEVSSL
jgi:hypothetical protein